MAQAPAPCARQAPCRDPGRACHLHLSNSPGHRRCCSHFLDGETEDQKDQVPSLWLPGKPLQPGVLHGAARLQALASSVLGELRPGRARAGGRGRADPEEAGRAGQEASGFSRAGASDSVAVGGSVIASRTRGNVFLVLNSLPMLQWCP